MGNLFVQKLTDLYKECFFFLLDNSNVRDSLVMKKPLPEKSLKKINTKYSGTCLIRHTKGPGKCVRLYRMSEPV